MDTVTIFCALNDFFQWFEPWWEQRLVELVPKRRRRGAGLCLSERYDDQGGVSSVRCPVTGRLRTIIGVRC